MDKLDEELASVIADEDRYSPILRAAAKLGKNTINKYYEATDESKIYQIATSKILRSLLVVCSID
jgi:hypothetical protein